MKLKIFLMMLVLSLSFASIANDDEEEHEEESVTTKAVIPLKKATPEKKSGIFSNAIKAKKNAQKKAEMIDQED
ncbi:MAG: hypothetical protein ACOYL6_12805 [Bacteriovoracaceae bacterium]